MNKYVAPELELVKFSVYDIILASGDNKEEEEEGSSSVENMLPIA